MMMTSSSRDENQRYPSSSRLPVSPVRYQRLSPANFPLVRSGSSVYPVNQASGLVVRSTAMRPVVPADTVSSWSS
jgi:hypothetical protein